MTNLTLDDIKMRIESAVYVMKLLPPVKVQGYHSTMPDIIYTPQEIAFMDRKPIKIRPTTEQRGLGVARSVGTLGKKASVETRRQNPMESLEL